MTLNVICGWPISGKSTTAKVIAGALSIHHVDIDEQVRLPVFGLPDPRPNTDPEKMRIDAFEMKRCYNLLYHIMEAYLSLNRSLIVTASFSRKQYWGPVLEILERYPGAGLKVVWCRPTRDTDEVITSYLAHRKFGVNCFSSVNSLERYKEVKERYHPIELPHFLLDTSRPLEETIAETIAYLQRP